MTSLRIRKQYRKQSRRYESVTKEAAVNLAGVEATGVASAAFVSAGVPKQPRETITSC